VIHIIELQMDISLEADSRDVRPVKENVGSDREAKKDEGSRNDKEGSEVRALGGLGGGDIIRFANRLLCMLGRRRK
jgi:hypothetical protein